ncbi:SpoIIE family protein phosphatase [Diplocloster agilis]|uniref:SpoIIE family protein phosphatase n=1 Tax=Diplocloster agilis TaxID=2850323 RepID=UPI0008203350|nr:SpoIIE family protein phosphatase [Suonthocola fibrivorans]MCU6733055.1 serine/threonine-protein phosphatase [Suonthocola fibrivorans]SCI74009.1 stage II sporulation protein E [uncultured Clostridium sp.]
MDVSVEVSYKSLNKFHEELCGDKVEIIKTADSDIAILADGMGSGVKANILATLTSKILGTMFQNGASIEDAVETIVKTLPICQVRKVAYATFSILQIFHNGEGYLVEFDNPECVLIRDKKLMDIPFTHRELEGKDIREWRFRVQMGDCFVLMSDGVVYAGAGEILNLGWTRDSMAEYALKCMKTTTSASRLTAMLSKACDDLYLQKPGDDTTVCVTRVIPRRLVSIFTGPPEDPDDDRKLMEQFMSEAGCKVVCGGTSANIAAKYLDKPVVTQIQNTSSDVPPMAEIEGMDLVTEGIITMNKALKLLRQYVRDEVDVDFFLALDEDNGAARLAKILIEECTELKLFVGKAVNQAYDATMDLDLRMNLIGQLKSVVERMGHRVEIIYF